MKLDGVILLAAYTLRSRAYAQALVAAGMEPDAVLMFGNADQDMPRDIPENPRQTGALPYFVPDFREGLAETCERETWNVIRTEAEHVNDPAIVRTVSGLQPKLVIYSGYGGQLVGSELLMLDIPILHCHAGWLPDFRGSTTIYYSALTERSCAVTAFLLSAGIDTGPIIAQKKYPLPGAGIDMDNIYDNAIRADILADVLRAYAASETSLDMAPQRSSGREYFVIHPVLKHVAILSLTPEGAVRKD